MPRFIQVTTTVMAPNFTCYAASLEDPTLAIFEEVDGGQDRVCRGKHPGTLKHLKASQSTLKLALP